jgi:hypothetical protein
MIWTCIRKGLLIRDRQADLEERRIKVVKFAELVYTPKFQAVANKR